MGETTAKATQGAEENADLKLFWACFIALITTAFGFIIRAMLMDTWAGEFGLSETQKGEIFGVGLWPFAISIVLFSLFIDSIGYGRAMVFAFVCHVVSVAVTVATPAIAAKQGGGYEASTAYWMLYVGNLIVGLGNGTVEAVINPVVATMFIRNKTKWLNILHAGWPGGLVLGGILVLALGAAGVGDWRVKVGLIALPTVAYGVIMLGCKFPVNERVAAGVSDKEMLAEFGALGALVVSFLAVSEIGRVFSIPPGIQYAVIGAITVGFFAYVQSLGRPMFVFLMLIMIPLATTELGTDSWITPLMESEMGKLGLPGVTVLIYTSFIMMVLRFFAGPIVHSLSPLGLLAASAGLAAVGLFLLSNATGVIILAAATLYAFGKTFFWPTMLGVTSEQFPKGGALTLNAMGGVGMLAVGVLGAPILGLNQDWKIDQELKDKHPAVHARYIGVDKDGLFGLAYRPLDGEKTKALDDRLSAAKTAKLDPVKTDADDKAALDEVKGVAGKTTLLRSVVFPVTMLAAYIVLIVYFGSRGGYRPVELDNSGGKAAH